MEYNEIKGIYNDELITPIIRWGRVTNRLVYQLCKNREQELFFRA